MYRRISAAVAMLLAAVALAACGGDADDKAATGATGAAQPGAAAESYARPDLLAETGWLAERLDDRSVMVVDLRERRAYDAGHLPGAVWYDQARLKDPDERLHVIRESLFAQAAGALGIHDGKTVVAYDDADGLWAARFWWVLWYYGHENAKVLNGGWQKWQAESRPVSRDAVTPVAATFTPKLNEAVICGIDDVKARAAKDDGRTVLLDVRSPGEYAGTDVRGALGGHIPSAVNLDWTTSMTATTPRVWKPAAELRRQFEQAGIAPGSEVITYCQIGVRGAHSLFTLRLMGHDSVRNYDGAWQEWSASDAPVERR